MMPLTFVFIFFRQDIQNLRLETEVLERQLMSYEQQQLEGAADVMQNIVERKINSDSHEEENDYQPAFNQY
jgi:hypothetical protein